MLRTFTCVVVVVLLLGGTALAGVSVSGNAVQDNPTSGTSYAQGSQEDNSNIHWFVEGTDFHLSSNITVDVTQPYSYLSGGHSNTPGTLSSGRYIMGDYYAHFDPVGTPSSFVGPVSITFTFTNGEYFIGAIFNSNTLKNTDSVLGLSGITYDGSNRRGMEVHDGLTISSNRTSVTITMKSTTDIDSIRILTAPEPTSFVLFGLGLAGMAGFGIRRRRRRRA